jgi:catechol 2,3-dioxygenase-like lactoylglutathione lyase family enzyme
MKPKFGFVVEYTNNIEEAKRFYVEVLGLEVRRSHPVWVEFEGFALAGDQSLTGTREPEVYWLVDDAEAAYAEVAGKAEIFRPLERMIFGKVFGIKDPAGRPRFILELAKERPSQAVK